MSFLIQGQEIMFFPSTQGELGKEKISDEGLIFGCRNLVLPTGWKLWE